MDESPEDENFDSGEVLYEFGEGEESAKDQWIKVEAAVDKAAVDHVMRDSALAQIKKSKSKGSNNCNFW